MDREFVSLENTSNCDKAKLSQNENKTKSPLGLIVAAGIGLAGLLITAIATPFVLPAFRKHCLPYVPATDLQLSNLRKSFQKFSIKNGSFLDIGSGDGRICRLANTQKLFSKVHGVELNYFLVTFSRLMAIKSRQNEQLKYFHKDLWKFSLGNYDNICIFGVESMMQPLEEYIIKSNNGKEQIIFACRFPFKNMTKVFEIGSGIDTVWIYRLRNESCTTLMENNKSTH